MIKMELLKEPIENLCFEGGSVKAFAFIGAIRRLEELGILKEIKRVIGSSAGCIFALGIACKISSKEMEEIVSSTDFSKFKDDSYGYVFDIIRVIKHYGICKGDELYNWYSSLLLKFTGKENITFDEMYKKTGIDFVITGTNLTKSRTDYFSHKTTPTLEVRLAMRISTSIPLFFKAIELDNDVYVDGGVLNNYPIWYFDKEGDRTLGLKLMGVDEYKEEDTIEHDPQDTSNIKNYIESLINSMMYQIEKGYIRKGYWEKSIIIDTGKVSTLEFNLDQNKKNWLVKQGYNSATLYFDNLKSV
jgi:NTE family protein